VKLRYDFAALQDVAEAADYIAAWRGPAAVLRFTARVQADARRLKDWPYMGRVGRKDGTRELVVSRTPYLIIYTLHEDTVEITRVLHGARRWPPPPAR